MTTLRNARILELRAGGMKIRLIAAEVGVTTHTVERVIYSNATAYVPRPATPRITRPHRCQNCQVEHQLEVGMFRCDPCKELARGVFEPAAAALMVGGMRGGAE